MDKKVNIAIMGCGNIASSIDDDPKKRHVYSHAKAIRMTDNCNIISCCDINEDTVNDFSNRWGIKNSYCSYEEMLDREKIDILVICTPTKFHFEHLKKDY